MTKVKLTYFDFPGGRGEECRLALHVAGITFEDNRINPKNWKDVKSSTPFGALPVLEIEGEGTLAQSNAILGLIGSRHGLLPDGDFQAAKHIAVLNAVEDMSMRIGATLRLNDEQKKLTREELVGGYMKQWAGNMEHQILGPFIAGQKLMVGDIKIFILTSWVQKGILDHIPANFFSDFPRLTSLSQAVAEHPRVKDWYS